MNLTMEERVARFETMYREGRIVREDWGTRDAEGREYACWLSALSPEVAVETDSEACPAEVMPQWLAQLVPHLCDSGTLEAWPTLTARFGRCAAGWHVLDAEAWSRVSVDVHLAILAVARDALQGDEQPVRDALDQVVQLVRGEASGRDALRDILLRLCDAQDVSRGLGHRGILSHAYHRTRSVLLVALGALETWSRPVELFSEVLLAVEHAEELPPRAPDPIPRRSYAADRVAEALFDALDREVAAASASADSLS